MVAVVVNAAVVNCVVVSVVVSVDVSMVLVASVVLLTSKHDDHRHDAPVKCLSLLMSRMEILWKFPLSRDLWVNGVLFQL